MKIKMNKIIKEALTALTALYFTVNPVIGKEGDLGRKLFINYNTPIKFLIDPSINSKGKSLENWGYNDIIFESNNKIRIAGVKNNEKRILYLDEKIDGTVEEVWEGLGKKDFITSIDTNDSYRKPTEQDQKDYQNLIEKINKEVN